MFVSLFNALLQTFIHLFAPVFDGLISNFIEASSGIIAAIFNGLIDKIIEYICGAIGDTYFANHSEIFTYGIDIGLKVVCLFVAAIGIDCIDGLTCSSRYGAIINGLLYPFNGVFNFAVITATTLTTIMIAIGFCLIGVSSQFTQTAVTTGTIVTNQAATRIALVALLIALMRTITRFDNLFKSILTTPLTQAMVTTATGIGFEYGFEQMMFLQQRIAMIYYYHK